MAKAADFGIVGGGPVSYDPSRMVARKNRVVDSLTKGIATLFKSWGIDHHTGSGRLVDGRTVQVTRADGSETRVDADAIVIATGSSWPNLPLFPVDGRRIITSKEALDLAAIP